MQFVSPRGAPPFIPNARLGIVDLFSLIVGMVCLSACGGGDGGGGDSTPAAPPTFTIGGMVSGLSGTGLVLQNNGSNNFAVAANGAFIFSGSVASGAAYAVTVSTQPSAPSQNCTVTGGAGTANGNVTNVAVTCTTNSFAVGGTVSGLAGTGLVVQNNGGNDLAVAANGAVTFANTVVSGGVYDIQVLTQPSAPAQRCTVINGSGTVASAAVISPTIECITQVPRFGYSADFDNASLSIYAVDATTGQLRPRGYVRTGNNPSNIAWDDDQRFMFVLNRADATVSAYLHNDTTGDLVEVSGSPYPTGGVGGGPDVGPSLLTVHPSGKFLYVTNAGGTNNIGAFGINQSSGELTKIFGSPFVAGTNPLAVTIDAAGAFAYVTNRGSNNIYTYSINPVTGALAEIESMRATTGNRPSLLSIHPNRRVAYVPNAVSGDLSVFTVNPTTGALIAVAGSPFAAGVNPGNSVYAHPSGKFLYLRSAGAPDGTSTIASFSLNQTTGALTPIGSPLAVGTNAIFFAADPAGKFIVVTNRSAPLASSTSGSLSVFSINSTTGALTPAGISVSVPVSPTYMYSDPNGQYLYLTSNGSNAHLAYSFNTTTGALAPIASGATITTRDYPLGVVVLSSVSTPAAATFSSKFAYVPNGGNSVGAYKVDASSGALSLVDTAAFGSMSEPRAAAVHPTGTSLFVTNGTDNSLAEYRITATGALTSQGAGGFTTGAGPSFVTLDPSGRFAYAANVTAQTISPFLLKPTSFGNSLSIGGVPVSMQMHSNGRFLYAATANSFARWIVGVTDGTLSAGGAVTLTGTVTAFTLDPNGRFAYVARAGGISVYSINPLSGFTANTADSSVATGVAHTALTVEPRGRFLYAANGAANTVSAFTINQSTGALTAVATPVAAGNNVTSIKADYSGKYVYAVNKGSATVSAYSIDATTGALSPIAGGSIATGTTPNGIALLDAIQ